MNFDETACYICAKCTSGCPTAAYDPTFKPHVIVARSKSIMKIFQKKKISGLVFSANAVNVVVLKTFHLF